MVSDAEAILDGMGELPSTSYSERRRQINGRTVPVSNTRVTGINLSAYASLLHSTNETARRAIVGIRGIAHKRPQIHYDLAPESSRIAFPANPDYSNESIDRLPGESQRAFHAFCVYRDLRTHALSPPR